jgi:alcohol dehydrogenase
MAMLMTTGILGNTIDGTQAEYVRIPHADSSLYPIPAGADEAALVMLSDIFPTGLECGVLNGKVELDLQWSLLVLDQLDWLL